MRASRRFRRPASPLSTVLAVLLACSAGAGVAACGSGGASSSAGAHPTTTGAGGAGGRAAGAGGSTGVGLLDGGGSGGDGSLGFDGDACGSMALATTVTPGNIVVVFDQSDSMHQPFKEADGGAAGPKFKVAETAIVDAIQPIEGLLNVGTIFFPTEPNGTVCSNVDLINAPTQLAIQPGASFITAFEGHFAAPKWSLILGTPLVLALKNASLALPDPSPLKGRRAVVLITDGAPTCDDNVADILAPVQTMAARGILTYAVGLPGSLGAATLLNGIAAAGGSGSYYSPGDPLALQAALAQIASQTVDMCTVTLSPVPPDPSEVYLIVTDPANPAGMLVAQSATDGWTLSPDGKTATLTGAVCKMAESGGYSSIQFVYGCPVLPK